MGSLDEMAYGILLKMLDRIEDPNHPGTPGKLVAFAYAVALAMRAEAFKHAQPTTIPIHIGPEFG